MTNPPPLTEAQIQRAIRHVNRGGNVQWLAEKMGVSAGRVTRALRLRGIVWSKCSGGVGGRRQRSRDLISDIFDERLQEDELSL